MCISCDDIRAAIRLREAEAEHQAMLIGEASAQIPPFARVEAAVFRMVSDSEFAVAALMGRLVGHGDGEKWD